MAVTFSVEKSYTKRGPMPEKYHLGIVCVIEGDEIVLDFAIAPGFKKHLTQSAWFRELIIAAFLKTINGLKPN